MIYYRKTLSSSGPKLTAVHPDEPLSDEELVDKFNELVEPRVGSKRTQALSRVILNESGILVREIANLWA